MKTDRKEEILNIAQYLTQEKGLNGFSYIDIAKQIGIKTSSIHYYFETKNDLAIALIKRYHEFLKIKLNFIDSTSTTSKEKLIKFSEIFRELADARRKFCLCGMMAAEWATLSKEAHKELLQYFQSCRQWLSCVFSLLGSKHSTEDAIAYLSLLEGSLLVARMEGQSTIISDAANAFIRKFV